MTPADLQTARGSALLSGLPFPLVSKLLDGAQAEDHAPGQTIYEQHEPPDALFILLDGWVRLSRVAPRGSEALVGVVHSGRSFGEVSAAQGAPHLVAARAITPCRVVRLDAARLRQIASTEIVVADRVLRVALAHLLQLVHHVEGLKTRTVVQRLAFFLLEIAEARDGTVTCRLPYSRDIIARQLGTAPESLSRAFARLRGHGVRVHADRAHIDCVSSLCRVMEEATA